MGTVPTPARVGVSEPHRTQGNIFLNGKTSAPGPAWELGVGTSADRDRVCGVFKNPQGYGPKEGQLSDWPRISNYLKQRESRRPCSRRSFLWC